MQITKITEEQPMPSPAIRKFTADELQQEYGYYLAQKLLKSMLDKELVSVDEFDKITALNRESFSPFLSEIMP